MIQPLEVENAAISVDKDELYYKGLDAKAQDLRADVAAVTEALVVLRQGVLTKLTTLEVSKESHGICHLGISSWSVIQALYCFYEMENCISTQLAACHCKILTPLIGRGHANKLRLLARCWRRPIARCRKNWSHNMTSAWRYSIKMW